MTLQMFDYLRIDHFRGFAGFWQIPAHEKLAVFGRWAKGPGAHFFKVLAKRFKSLPIIAEDLGEITPDVIELNEKIWVSGHAGIIVRFQRRHLHQSACAGQLSGELCRLYRDA